MKLSKTWILVVLISIGIFYWGKYEKSHLYTFIGAIGSASGVTCEALRLITHFLKIQNR